MSSSFNDLVGDPLDIDSVTLREVLDYMPVTTLSGPGEDRRLKDTPSRRSICQQVVNSYALFVKINVFFPST